MNVLGTKQYLQVILLNNLDFVQIKWRITMIQGGNNVEANNTQNLLVKYIKYN